MTEEDWDTLGRLVDRLDSAITANELPMSDSLKITGMLGIVRDVRDALKEFVIENGENFWGET